LATAADGYMYEHIFKSKSVCAAYSMEVLTEIPNDQIIGIQLAYHGVSELVDYEVFFAALVLGFVYVLIIFELIHRTLSAMLGSLSPWACSPSSTNARRSRRSWSGSTSRRSCSSSG